VIAGQVPGKAPLSEAVDTPVMRTAAQRAGDIAEALVARQLEAMGWTILARRLRVGRLELDLVAVDPGPPPRLVAVEVRWRAGRDFGSAEETVDRRKLGRLRRAIWRLAELGRLPDGPGLPSHGWAIDVVTVEPPTGGDRAPRVRHHRDVLAG
jgi:putative endonuclease